MRLIARSVVQFYLWVLDGVDGESMWSIIVRPFKPFSKEAWLLMVMISVFYAAVQAFVDQHNRERFPRAHWVLTTTVTWHH